MTDSPQPDSPWRKLGLFTVIVADLIGYTSAGLGLGYLLCKKLSAPWWVILVTTLAGLGLAMYRVYEIGKKEF